jgi:hypothetical protein
MESLKKYLPLLMFSCKKASELINKSEVFELSFREKFILFYHNTICRTCHHYKKQSAIIENAFKNSFKKNRQPQTLSEESKLKIIENLKAL